jgi:hypothetical protein
MPCAPADWGATKGLLVSTSNWLSVRSLTLGRILSRSRGAVGVPGLAAHASLNVDLLLVSDGPIFETGENLGPEPVACRGSGHALR